MIIRNWKLTAGEAFTEQDVRAGTKVALLGTTVAKELFGKENPIGKTIRMKRLPFKVIGVLEELGKTPDGRDQDDAIFAPVKTVQRKLMGKTNYSAFILSTKTKERMSATADMIKAILRQRHNLAENEDDDFTFFTQNDIAQASDAASQVLNLLLLIIASISLIVGGIGIMNIMLVSVTERTREIGIRMALGATTRAILIQFILEAITICLTGGFVGMVFGIGVSEFIGFVLDWPIFISKSALAISLGSSALIGLFFGYYPAYKASQLNPVDALIET
jgi:putative ABC transport system permease protein